MERITLQEAEHNLGKYIMAVEKGETVIILKQNKPVACLTPYAVTRQLSSQQIAARERTLARMKQGFSLGGICPIRDRLHER